MTFLRRPFCDFRYALQVSYLGSRYCGLQRLTGRGESNTQETIQEAIEWSLEDVIRKKNNRLTAASRTDKGVHALMNYFTLSMQDYSITTERLKLHANWNLCKKNHDICVKDIILVPVEFHPRKNAISREYIYRIAVIHNARAPFKNNHKPSSLLDYLPVNELYKILPLPRFDVEKAHEAINLLKGTHDFASFAREIKKDDDSVRDLDIELREFQPVTIDHSKNSHMKCYSLIFRSRSFLYNQVRRTVGAIISYATYQKVELGVLKDMLENPASKNWPPALVIAEPWGLFLSKIKFDRDVLKGSIRTYLDEESGKVIEDDNISGWSDDVYENQEKNEQLVKT